MARKQVKVQYKTVRIPHTSLFKLLAKRRGHGRGGVVWVCIGILTGRLNAQNIFETLKSRRKAA